MTDPLRPAGSRAWTRVSAARSRTLPPGYEVQFRRFIGIKGWQRLTPATKHEPRTAYRARLLSSL